MVSSGYLWRAVDHGGEVLEAVVTAKRDKAEALLKRIMKKYGAPRSIVTDELSAYSAAMNEIACADLHEVGRHLNNQAENSHLARARGIDRRWRESLSRHLRTPTVALTRPRLGYPSDTDSKARLWRSILATLQAPLLWPERARPQSELD
jgi:IS1 family transposase